MTTDILDEDWFPEQIRKTGEEKGVVTILPTSLAELMAMEFPPNHWLVENLIPLQAITVIHGAPMSLKTWIVLELAIQAAQGNKLFNHFETVKTGSLLIDMESGEWLLQDRFKTLQANSDLPIHYLTMESSEFTIAYARGLAKWCNKHDIKLVIIDSLTRIHSGDENTSKDSNKIFGILRQLTKRGLTVVLIHHNRKGGKNKEDDGEAMRGSSDIQASIDCQISVRRPYNDEYLTIKQIKCRNALELPMMELNFKKHDDGHSEFIYLGQIANSGKQDVKPVILQVIAEKPGLSQKDIHSGLEELGHGINEKTLRSLLKALESGGEILKTKGNARTYCYFINNQMSVEDES
jgi:hypothetical protein